MDYTVRNAKPNDLQRIEAIYAYARSFMAQNGNPTQWGTCEPPYETLVNDIEENNLFVIESNDQIHGVFYFHIGEDPTYQTIYDGSWRSETPYGTIHRIAGDGSGGILRTAVTFAEKQIDHIRIDTHHDNHIMQQALRKLGFDKRGIIYIADGSARIAYNRLV